jgi:PA14 domain-containing protein
LSRRGYTVLVDPGIQGDPLLTFAAGNRILQAYDPGVPVPLPVPQGGLALIIPPESQSVLDDVRGSYPSATVIPLTPNFDRTQVRATVVLIHPEDAARTAGITVAFDTGAHLLTRTHQPGQVPWPPGSGPTSRAVLRGTLQISSAQSWQPLAFRIAGAGQAAITIDGETWPDATAGTPAICLGAGNHALSAVAEGSAAMTLELQSAPGSACSQRDELGSWSALPLQSLAGPELPTGGLLGLYYNGPAINGQPALVRVDATVNTYYQEPPRGTSFPFAAQWLGYLTITQSGVYTFKLSSTGPSTLTIDGAQVVTSPSDGSGAAVVPLQPGRHSVGLRYFGTGHYLHCYLTWAPPGKDFAPIPPSMTEPAHG